MLKITRARAASSLAIVRALDREIFPDDEPIETAGRRWWIARLDGEPCAFAGLREGADGIWYLSRAGVLESARGHGIHGCLIRTRIADVLDDPSAREIQTYTLATNPASGNNLIEWGFRMFRPERPWWDHGDSEIVYWRRRL